MLRVDRIHQGRQVRALAVTTAARSEALPDIPTVGEFVPGYEASAWCGIGAPEGHAGRDHRQAQQRDQCGSRRSQDQGAPRRPGRHRACRARPPTSASLSPTKPRSGARWSNSRASSRSDPGKHSITSVPRTTETPTATVMWLCPLAIWHPGSAGTAHLCRLF